MDVEETKRARVKEIILHREMSAPKEPGQSQEGTHKLSSVAVAGLTVPKFEGSLKTYLSQLNFFLLATGVTDEGAKKNILLSNLPREQFVLATDLVLPLELESADVSYKELKTKLAAFEAPEKSRRVARFEFDRTEIRQGESIMEFSVRLGHAAKDCKFNADVRDERLCDRFISGISRSPVLKTLLKDDTVEKFDQLVAKAVAAEKLISDAELISLGGQSPTLAVARFPVTCFTCGIVGHTSRSCSRNHQSTFRRRGFHNRPPFGNRGFVRPSFQPQFQQNFQSGDGQQNFQPGNGARGGLTHY